jgi:hypothetical protein
LDAGPVAANVRGDPVAGFRSWISRHK